MSAARWLLLVLVAACGAPGSAPEPDAAPPDADPGELAPFEGWPENVLVRRTGEPHHTMPSQLEIDLAGRLWLLRDEGQDGQVFNAPVLERYAANGRLEKRITFLAGALVPEIV